MTPGAHSPYMTERFARRLEEVRVRDPAGHARVQEVIARLLENPADADGRLHGRLRGRLKKYVGRRDYRIVYTACEECRKANLHVAEACPHCGAIPERSVVFYDLFRKGDRDYA